MITEVIQADSAGIKKAVSTLLSGGLVAIPTETVYGLAANAFDASAVAKIFAAKERPSFDPLIVQVSTVLASIAALSEAEIIDSSQITRETRVLCEKLIQNFWPGPLTLILPKSKKIPDLVTAGLPQVGIRMPAHRAAKRVLLDSSLSLAAPSANRFGRISPTTAEHVLSELEGRIPLILDGGASAVGVESTVVRVEGNKISVLRPGGITIEELKQVAGNNIIVEIVSGVAGTGTAMLSPGTSASHYAPSKPVLLWQKRLSSIVDSLQLLLDKSNTAAILFTKGHPDTRLKDLPIFLRNTVVGYSLSREGNAEEAARNLFSALRALDESEASVIFAEEPFEEIGLWHAIRDRLVRASGSKLP